MLKLKQIEEGNSLKQAVADLKTDTSKIDSNIKGMQTSMAALITKVQKVLDITKWDKLTHKQTISDPNIKANSAILLSLPVGTADDVFVSFTAASIVAREQKDGSIVFEYTGAAPKQSYFIDLCIL